MDHGASYGWDLLGALVVKSTLLVLTAGLLQLVARRSPAATRHLILSLTLGVLLLLPVFHLLLPRWQVSLIPTAPSVRVPFPDSMPIAYHAAEARLPELARPLSSAPLPTVSPILPVPESSRPSSHTLAPQTKTNVRSIAAPGRAPNPGRWAFLFWEIGFLISLLPLAQSLVALSRLRKQSRHVDDGPLAEIGSDVARMLPLSRRVILLIGSRDVPARMPIAWGWFRPTIWLPEAAANWPETRLRIVLLHERAHLARGDSPLRVLAQVICSLYWFHPGVWWLAHRLRQESERACDDRVLLAGIAPSTYAQTLLEVIRSMRHRHPVTVGTVAMATLSHLEDRLHAILDLKTPRQPPSRRRALAATSLALSVFIPLAAVHIGARAASPQEPKKRAEASRSTTPAETPTRRAAAQERSRASEATETEEQPGNKVAAERQTQTATEQALRAEVVLLRKRVAELEAMLKRVRHEDKQRAEADAAEAIEDLQQAQKMQLEQEEQRLLSVHKLFQEREQQYQAGLLPKIEMRKAQAEMEQAKARLMEAKARLDLLAQKKAGKSQADLLLSQQQILRLRLQQSEAALSLADEIRKTRHEQFQAGVITQREIEQAEAELKSRLAEHELLRHLLESNQNQMRKRKEERNKG